LGRSGIFALVPDSAPTYTRFRLAADFYDIGSPTLYKISVIVRPSRLGGTGSGGPLPGS